MLGRGNFRVATSRGHLTDMVDLSPGSSLLVVLDRAGIQHIIDEAQQRVAGGVAKRVVDFLEAVQVHHQHAKRTRL